MVDKKTYVLVTCKAGNEEWCEEEIGNVLFHYDPNLMVKRTNYKGVLVVETSIDPDRVYAILSSREYGFVEKIIPFHRVLVGVDIDKIVEAVKNLFIEKSYRGDIRLYIVFRGVRGVSGLLWKKLVNELRGLGITVSKKSSKCLYIESINSFIGISFIDCK